MAWQEEQAALAELNTVWPRRTLPAGRVSARRSRWAFSLPASGAIWETSASTRFWISGPKRLVVVRRVSGRRERRDLDFSRESIRVEATASSADSSAKAGRSRRDLAREEARASR